MERRGAESGRVVAGWIGSGVGRWRNGRDAIARDPIEAWSRARECRGKEQRATVRPYGLIDTRVLVRTRAIRRRQLGRSLLNVKGATVVMRLVRVAVVRKRVGQP